MALVHPSLNMTGKRKAKVKFKSAEEAQRARQLESDWTNLQKKWGVEADTKRITKAMKAPALEYKLTAPAGRETQRIGSRDTGHMGAISSKQIPKYTGTKMLGIGQMAKSNAVPIFSKEEAIAVATMRRG
jgi:hypothetical protein